MNEHEIGCNEQWVGCINNEQTLHIVAWIWYKREM